MGEVYRARDTKLDRDVAVKVLPQSLSADRDALARFEREAKAVAALSHPNILAILDFGTHEGTAYAVMELLEGETLRASSTRGPIPQKQAVDYALQVAKGLSAAHEKGIVHRDLKPENLFVSRDGHLKILDFGLAKKVEAVSPGEQTRAPTGSGHTEPGTVMGTMGYMSPEQVGGCPSITARTSSPSGRSCTRCSRGRRRSSGTRRATRWRRSCMQEPPELTQSGRNISPALDHIVRHCLEKDRDNRFQSARDIAFALSEDVARRASRAARGSPRRRPARGRFSSPLRRSSFSLSRVSSPAPAAPGRGRGRRRQACGGAAVREPGCSRGRLLRRRHRGRDPRQADVLAGPAGDRPWQLDALQEDDQDAQADRRGAGVAVPPDRHGALGEERRARAAST